MVGACGTTGATAPQPRNKSLFASFSSEKEGIPFIAFLTDFADQAVLLPLAALLALALAVTRQPRALLAWLATLAATFGLVLALKLLGHACGWRLHSPSGHSAGAALLAGVLATLLLPARRPIPVAALAALLAAAAIGITRLALHLHTPAEILAGAFLGTAGAVAFAATAGPAVPLPRRVLALAAVAVLALAHGRHFDAEPAIDRTATYTWPLSACAPAGPNVP